MTIPGTAPLTGRKPGSTRAGRLAGLRSRLADAYDRARPRIPDGTPLREVLREDREVNYGWYAPGFHALAVHRLGAWSTSDAAPSWARTPARAAYRAGYLFVRGVYGIEIPRTVTVGRRVEVGHQSGIVVHPHAVLGDECILRQGVTLGGATDNPVKLLKQGPKIGSRVSLGAGCAVIGGVTIGEGASIGPNVTVMTSIPAGAMVLPAQPRIVRRAPSAAVAEASR
ncbi:MAG TPA: hypothetical protein VES01_10370 [Dermatophilaceae bacterium]|nr:hypothetical protein [Dermatophilaceae bacterium]